MYIYIYICIHTYIYIHIYTCGGYAGSVFTLLDSLRAEAISMFVFAALTSIIDSRCSLALL